MRKSAIALAFLATFTTVNAQADDDFSALLADLDFGDASPVTETLTPITEPAKLVMPEIMAPQVTLQSPVSQQPISQQPAADDETVDLEAAFALQESKSGVQAQPTGHLFSCAKDSGCDSDACDSELVCAPHTAPNLPTSTFYQYFRSNKCNSHVWDGYRQPCRSANKHLNGTCDCFKEKKKLCGGGECGQIIDAPVVECNNCDVRPRRQILPIKKSCDDCTSCDAGCDS